LCLLAVLLPGWAGCTAGCTAAGGLGTSRELRIVLLLLLVPSLPMQQGLQINAAPLS